MKSRAFLTPSSLRQFYYGAAYYPENWDAATRQQDAERMGKACFNCVRMGEFAWSIFEPSPDHYDFTLYDETIEQLGKIGIYTILGTPTATPPRWLTAMHPEINRITQSGSALQHGSRQHACITNPIYRVYSQQITRALVLHYQHNPYVIGWQIDNELNCEFSECHCQACQSKFQEFLQDRYHNEIRVLNQAWGAVFWNQTYSNFNEILIPRQSSPTFANPSELLDYYRFISSTASSFLSEQAVILHKVKPDWFITHNAYRYPDHFPHIDFRGAFSKELDVLGYDIYPGFIDRDSDSSGTVQAFNLDLARSWTGNFIILEHQSGPAGQSPFLFDTPLPGEMRRMAYSSIARGADGLLFFRWRTSRFGPEEYCCGILDHDSVPRRRYDEAVRLGQELKKLRKEIINTSVHVDVGIASGDFDVEEGDHAISLGLPSPDTIAERVHRYFHQNGFAVGCVHLTDDLSGLKIYILPHWSIFDPAWVTSLSGFTNKGGILIIGARSGTRDLSNLVIADTPPGPLQKLTGITVDEYGKQNQPDKKPMYIKLFDDVIRSEYWYEKLQTKGDVRVIGLWTDCHLNGEPGITIRKQGRGWVIYVGTYLSEPILEHLVKDIDQHLKIDLPRSLTQGNIEVVQRESQKTRLWFFINHSDESVQVNSIPAGINILTEQPANSQVTLEGNEVAIIKQDIHSS